MKQLHPVVLLLALFGVNCVKHGYALESGIDYKAKVELLETDCASGDILKVHYAIGSFGKEAVINARGEGQFTCIHFAAQNGKAELVAYLLALGMGVDTLTITRWTPLHIASHGGHYELATLLIASGANVSAMNWLDSTPLYLAAEKEYFNLTKLLIDSGADMDVMTDIHMTPLYTAIDEGRLPMAEFLLEAGANPNITVEFGVHFGAGGNAVHLAVLRNKVAFIRLLADYGANLEMRDGDGLTPLGRAVKESPDINRLDVITELVAVGAALDEIQGMEYDEAVEEAIRRGKRLREERQ